MIGVNITSKSGLMLFSHFFVPGFTDVDEDLRAGLMTAVLNAMKDSQNGTDRNVDSTGLKAINQGRYYVHIAEGQYTYGLFFSFENDLKEQDFAEKILSKFESKFQNRLEDDLAFDPEVFDAFQDYLKEEYSQLISIDVVGLSKIINLMETAAYPDYIILERPYLHQVMTTISIPDINPIANTLGLMCKNLLETGLKIGMEISRIRFRLGQAHYVLVDTLKNKFFLILVVPEKERERAEREMTRIQNRLNDMM